MGWKKKAVIGTILLFVIEAALAIAMHRQIVNTSFDQAAIEYRDDVLAGLCGKVAGVGMVAIWFGSFKRRQT